MTTSKVYTVRKRTDSADLKDLFKVYLSPMALQLQSLAPGDLCMILKAGDVKGPVIVWPAPEKLLDTVILLSNRLKELYEIKLGEKISLSHNNYSLEDSSHVKLREVLQANPGTSSSTVSEADKPHWAWLSEYHLQEAKIICPGLVFDVEAKREKRTFVVIDVNSSSDRIFSRVQPKTKVSISDVSPTDGVIASHSFNTLHISGDGIGGLEKQLKQLNKRLSAYSNEEEGFECPPYHQPRRGGIILHGAPGTGKSTILRNFARAGWRKVLQIDTSIVGRRSVDIMNSVRQIFEESRGNQPSLVIIDKLELLAGKRSLHSDETLANIAPELGRELDQLGSARVLVVAATAFLENIDETLREPGRFEFDIEIPVPSSKARGEILKVLHWQAKDAENKMLEDLADRTHGFVGADLESLTQRAVDKAKARLSDSRSAEAAMVGNAGLDVKPKIKVEVTATDLNEALLEVRPRAMRQVFLQTPNVKWSDIGGQSEVKKALVQAVEWPFKYAADMAELGIEPKKGLLLYGPPGCSKTLVAKALATESGLNFLAVKGGELLSMYVGESERAVREVFRKARSASPSILFFDEIDAIGGLREGNAQQGGLNIVTTLLNELDGIELLQGVFVLAATNNPAILDPALMRPGRFETKLFVGLPDDDARGEILQITLGKMAIDAEVSQTNLIEWTRGHSGAEIVSICQKAGYAALEDRITSRTKQKIGLKHLKYALAQVPREITAETIERYQNWATKGYLKPA